MKKLRLYTLDDYNKGLKPTCTRNGQKIDFIKQYPNSHNGQPFSCVLEDGSIIVNGHNGEYVFGLESIYDLMIQEDYQVGDWIITEGYSQEYDGKALRITKIYNSVDQVYATFEPTTSKYANFNLKRIVRLATEEEIAEAKNLLEPEYVPFTWEDRDQLRGKWVKHKMFNWEWQIVSIRRIREDDDSINTNVDDSKGLLENCTFLDGSPVGKIKK